MKKSLAIILVAATLTAGHGMAAGLPELPPQPLRDVGMKPLLRVREYQYKDYTSAGVPNTIPCRVRYTDRYFGYLKDGDYYRQGKMPFQSVCYDSDNPHLTDGVPVRYDKEVGKWVRDSRVKLWSDYFTEAERRATERSVQIYSITSVNAKGFALTQDEINGEPQFRERHFSYCLFKPPKALCGSGQVGQIAHPKSDLTAYALQLIRSIEFLDDAPAAVAPAASDAASAPP
jgi:hypothetical protein